MPEDGKTLLDFKALSSIDDRVGSRRCRSHNSNDTPHLSLGIDCEQFFAASRPSLCRSRCVFRPSWVQDASRRRVRTGRQRLLTEGRQKDNLRASASAETTEQMHRFFLVFAIPLTLAAQYQNNLRVTWIEPGGKEILPAIDQFENSLGKLGVIQASGPVDTTGHPFFTPLGTNGRACVNCHQPAYGMSVSAASLRERLARNRWEGSGVCGIRRVELSRLAAR